MSGKLHLPPSRWTQVKLYSPREESFPFPLRYIDVSRITQTNLDVMQVSRIDDYWNIDGSRDLSDFLDRFHSVYSIRWETSRQIYVVRGETDKTGKRHPGQDHLWPELWTKLGRNAELKEKQKRSIEKPKLDNVRRLRGIYFIDPEEQGVQRNQ